MALLRPALIILCAALAAGCAIGPRGEVAGPSGPIIDGWPIGRAAECAESPRCEELVSAATKALGARDGPFNPAIVSTSSLLSRRGSTDEDHWEHGRCVHHGRWQPTRDLRW